MWSALEYQDNGTITSPNIITSEMPRRMPELHQEGALQSYSGKLYIFIATNSLDKQISKNLLPC